MLNPHLFGICQPPRATTQHTYALLPVHAPVIIEGANNVV